MYIDKNEFEDWLEAVGEIEGISPGGLAHQWNVSRQTVNNWVNGDIIDAYRYKGREGTFIIIDEVESFSRIKEYRARQ